VVVVVVVVMVVVVMVVVVMVVVVVIVRWSTVACMHTKCIASRVENNILYRVGMAFQRAFQITRVTIPNLD
jgi:hypothetical protein